MTNQRQRRWNLNFKPARLLIGMLVLTGIAMGVFVWQTASSFRMAQNMQKHYMRICELQGSIVHLDEGLTMSARMSAATGDPLWEARYHSFEPKLDLAIQEV